MVFTGTLIAFLAAISWTISIFPFTIAGRMMTVTSMNIIRMVLGTLLVMITAFIFESNNISGIFSENYLEGWLWLGFSGLLALGLGDYFTFKMYTILSPRYGSVLTTLSPAAALMLGIILLNEHINFIGMLGMAITIIGVMTMSLGRTERSAIPDHGHGSILSGLLFGIFGALCSGAGLAFSKKGFLLQADAGFPILPVTGGFVRFFVATIVVLLILAFNKKLGPNLANIKVQPARALGMAAMGTVFGPLLAVSLAMICIQYINVAVAQTIFALVPVLALLISHFVYREKITKYAVGGVIAAIAGVMILIWRNDIMMMAGY